MAERPYWSGQLKISLVSFGIQMFSATNTHAGIAFHQIDRRTGQRVRHLNVIDGDHPVENSEIVKGYEAARGEYLLLEPDEIAKLRIPTKNVLEVSQFVDLDELPLALFEKPYFVVAQMKQSADAFAVIRRAMEQSGKAALGEIAFAGREHLVAITVPQDKSASGLMAYTLRYGAELRSSADFFSSIASGHIETKPVDKKQLAMATDLIRAYSSPLNLDAFKDDYEAALHALIEAKQKNLPLPLDKGQARRPKAINIMNALRGSLANIQSGRKPVKSQAPKRGPLLVKGNRRKRKVA